MKKIVLCAVLATAAVIPLTVSAAGTQTFCNAGSAAASTATATASTSDFVKVAFTPRCSANVFLVGNDVSSTLYQVGAASNKGKSKFAGTSNGGSVSGTDCATAGGPCVVGDATTAAGGSTQ